MITPLGSFSGWYYSEELKKARDLGYNIQAIIGYTYSKKAPIFKNFINKFY